ncbi:MAG: hypothetical protein AMXMBFR57_01020 [Acidimicrobiia bacterium]
MRRLLGDGWHPDIPFTIRANIARARQHRGRIASWYVALAEATDLAKVAAQRHLGHRPAITGGVPPDHNPRQNWSPRPMLDDIRHGWIRLVRQPRAALGVIALVALAVGVTSAMFSIVDAFLLSPAPFRNAHTFHRLGIVAPQGAKRVSEAELLRTVRDLKVFDAAFATGLNAVGQVEGRHGTTTRPGSWVPPGLFAELGVTPLLGREFEPGEGVEGNSDQVLLSEQTWREQFDADPRVVGSTIRVTDKPMLVVGVMPGHLRFPVRGNGIWRPYDVDRPPAEATRTQLMLFARRPVTMPMAEAADRAAHALRESTGIEYRVELSGASSGLLDTYSRESIVTLAIGVGLLFFLLCLNVTNLILARTTSRQVEFGVCAAMGASRWRLLRQAFFENVALGVVGAVMGLGLSVALIQLAIAFMPEDLAWRTLNPLDVDIRAIIATSALGLLATVLAGLPAAWLGTRGDVNRSLQLATRGGSAHRAARYTQTMLLVGEIALAVALLAAAGLQVRSFINLATADRGLDTSRVLFTRVTLPEKQFPDAASRYAVLSELESRLAALPGVAGTSLAPGLPPDGGSIHFGYQVTTDVPAGTPVEIPFMFGYRVPAGFFDTLGVRLVAGRDFNDADSAEAAVISRRLAQAVFGDADPVGRVMTFGTVTHTIVGVAEEIRNSLSDPREDYPELYTHRSRALRTAGTSTAIAIRCADPCATRASLETALATAQPGMTTTPVAPIGDAFMAQLARPQTATTVATGFAGLALFATAVGLFGIMSQAVARRRREFGIRAAVGAEPQQLRRLVLRDALRICALGLALGVGAGWALGRWLESVQYGVTFFDPLTWMSVALVVSTVTIVACWSPARLAMRTNPVALLRES